MMNGTSVVSSSTPAGGEAMPWRTDDVAVERMLAGDSNDSNARNNISRSNNSKTSIDQSNTPLKQIYGNLQQIELAGQGPTVCYCEALRTPPPKDLWIPAAFIA
jgi:hypothetical protein